MLFRATLVATLAATACSKGAGTSASKDKPASAPAATTASGSGPGTASTPAPEGPTAAATPKVSGDPPAFKTVFTSADGIVFWDLDPTAPFALLEVDTGNVGGASLLCSISLANPKKRLVNLATGAHTDYEPDDAGLNAGYVAHEKSGKVERLGEGGKTTTFDVAGVFALGLKTKDAALSVATAPPRLIITTAAGAKQEIALADDGALVSVSADETKAYLTVGANPTVLYEADLAALTLRRVATVDAGGNVEIIGTTAFGVWTTGAPPAGGGVSVYSLADGKLLAKAFDGAPARSLFAKDPRFAPYLDEATGALQVFDAKLATLIKVPGKGVAPFVAAAQALVLEGDAIKAFDLETGVLRGLSQNQTELASAAHPAKVSVSPDGLSAVVGGVDAASRNFAYQLSPHGSAPRPLDLGLAAGYVIRGAEFGPKGKWLLVDVGLGEALTPVETASGASASVTTEDACGRYGYSFEAYLVRADGTQALRLFHVDGEHDGVNLPEAYKFDGQETRLYHVRDGNVLEAFDLPP